MSERKYKQYHYREAKFMSRRGVLQSLLEGALSKMSLAVQRSQPIKISTDPDADVDQHVICTFRRVRDTLCGEFVSYAPGKGREVIAIDPAAKQFEPAPVSAPRVEGGKKGEFLDASLYFCIFNNHVVVSQSRGLQAPAFRDHLNWLLRAAQLMGDDDGVELDPSQNPATDSYWREGNVKSIVFGRPLVENVRSDQRASQSMRVVPDSAGWEAFKALLPTRQQRTISNMTLDGALEPESIEMFVELKIGKNDSAQKVGRQLAAVAFDAAHSVDGFRLELRDGTKVTADDFVRKGKTLVTHRDGIPLKSELFDGMTEWLSGVVAGP